MIATHVMLIYIATHVMLIYIATHVMLYYTHYTCTHYTCTHYIHTHSRPAVITPADRSSSAATHQQESAKAGKAAEEQGKGWHEEATQAVLPL